MIIERNGKKRGAAERTRTCRMKGVWAYVEREDKIKRSCNGLGNYKNMLLTFEKKNTIDMKKKKNYLKFNSSRNL
jgi:hypothetical protein